MTEPISTADTNPPARSFLSRLPVLAVLALVIVGAGAAIGVPIGNSQAQDDAKAAERAAERASKQEDELRDRRDELDLRVEQIDRQAKGVPEVSTKGPLMASAKTTDTKEFGDEFSVDGGTYTVNSLDVVESFTSADARRPAKKIDGSKYALVDVDFTNRLKEEQSVACGTMGTVRIVLEDGSTLEEIDYQPPIHPDTTIACGEFIPPGKSVHWVVPIIVPDGTKIAGVHVQDVYAHSSGSEFNVRSGKAAWIPLEKEVTV